MPTSPLWSRRSKCTASTCRDIPRRRAGWLPSRLHQQTRMAVSVPAAMSSAYKRTLGAMTTSMLFRVSFRAARSTCFRRGRTAPRIPMTISGTGATDVTLRRPVPREGGFSLVELLVAVFIMALASTAIILAAPKRPDPAAAAVTRLAGLVTELVDGAVLTGETRSLLVGPASIRMQTWRDGDWRELPVRPVRLGSAVRAETVNR